MAAHGERSSRLTPMRTNVYIDGLNLFYGAVRGTAYKWLNPCALVQALLPQASINRMRYFTARVKAHPDDPDAPIRQLVYLRALATLPMLDIIQGHFKLSTGTYPIYPYRYAPGSGRRARPLMEQVIKPEEKGTDVNIATHLLLDCFRGDFDQAVVVSNDSDLATPVRVVRDDFGKTVVVVNPVQKAQRGVRDLERASTHMVHRISPGLLANCQFPTQLTDARGVFSKPRGW